MEIELDGGEHSRANHNQLVRETVTAIKSATSQAPSAQNRQRKVQPMS